MTGVAVGTIFRGYFRLNGLIRKSFCAVKLLGWINSNSAFHDCQRSNSLFANALVSIFFDIRYASKSTGAKVVKMTGASIVESDRNILMVNFGNFGDDPTVNAMPLDLC